MEERELFEFARELIPGDKFTIVFEEGKGPKQTLSEETRDAVGVLFYMSQKISGLDEDDGCFFTIEGPGLTPLNLLVVNESGFWDQDRNRTVLLKVGPRFDPQIFAHSFHYCLAEVRFHAKLGGETMRTIDRNALLREDTDLAGRFRLVTEEDIQPGAELYMAHIRIDRTAEFPQPIRLDEEPVKNYQGKPYVYYHCRHDAPDLQCFVPMDHFAGEDVEADTCGPYCTALYLALVAA